jgi:heterodisulfide reductase subunit A
MRDNFPNVIVVGGGIAGMTAAGAAADLGMGVMLVERDGRLGGHAANWACMATDECARCSACLVQDQISRISAHPAIEIVLGARVAEFEGEAGDFRITLEPEPTSQNLRPPWRDWVLGERRTVPCQAVVLATGSQPYDPTDNPLLGYGHFDGVVTTRDLDDLLRQDDLAEFAPDGDAPLRVAFIQCVGSRDRKSGREYCSQFCCRTTIRLVQRLRYLRPAMEATVFYIDLQIMSKEFGAFYDRVRDKVQFVQGVPAEVCRGETDGTLRVYSVPPGTDRANAFEFDRVVLAIGLVPSDSQRSLAQIMGLDLNEFGYFAKSGLDTPLEASRPGVFLAGAGSGPCNIQGSRKQAMAVAGLLARLFGHHGAKKPSRSTHWHSVHSGLPIRHTVGSS